MYSNGSQSPGGSAQALISGDGRCVVFETTNALVPEDTNFYDDVYLYDRMNHSIERVDVGSTGGQANFGGTPGSVSYDGRFVAFESSSDNLVPGVTSLNYQVYVRDRQLSTTYLVSADPSGGPADFHCWSASISADGRFVAFESTAANLVPGDTNAHNDIFVRDLQSLATERVSVSSGGTQANADSMLPSISSDGRFVAFSSRADNLVPGDTSFGWDIFVRDRQAGMTERVSLASDGTQQNFDSDQPSISADGRFVVFTSTSSNLVPGDTNHSIDVFLRDRASGTTSRLSVSSDGTEASSGSGGSTISADGTCVLFFSEASDLVRGHESPRRFVRPRSLWGYRLHEPV